MTAADVDGVVLDLEPEEVDVLIALAQSHAAALVAMGESGEHLARVGGLHRKLQQFQKEAFRRESTPTSK